MSLPAPPGGVKPLPGGGGGSVGGRPAGGCPAGVLSEGCSVMAPACRPRDAATMRVDPDPTLVLPLTPWSRVCRGLGVGQDGGVQTTDAPASHPHHHRPPLVRPVHGRVLAGVAQGLAGHLGVSPTVVRVVLLVLAAAGAAGVVLYGFLWIFVPEERMESAGQLEPPRGERSSRAVWVVVLGVLLLLVGVAALSGATYDVSGWLPLLLVTAGAVFAWAQLDHRAGSRWIPGGTDSGRGAVVRTALV